MNCSSIPANIVWMSIDELNQYSYMHCFNCWFELKFPLDYWTFIPFDYVLELESKRCLIYDGGLISLQMIEFCSIEELIQYSREHCFDQWLELCLIVDWICYFWTFEFSSLIWTIERTFEFCSNIPAKLLTWANEWILIDELNQYSCEIVDLYRYSWVIDWILIDELNQYSREIVDLYRYSWANVWILINDLNCNSRANDWILIQYSREIVDLSERLNFHRWFETNV